MQLQGMIVIAAVAAIGLTGCRVQSELGKECTLVSRDPPDTDTSDGVRSIPLTEAEIAANKDFISFGATDCEDFTCVRDQSDEPGAVPEAEAKGFCSGSCLTNNPDSCLTGNDEVDNGPNPFVCRQLLLDEETLAAIRAADPERYRRIFGDAQTAYYCARQLEQTQQ